MQNKQNLGQFIFEMAYIRRYSRSEEGKNSGNPQGTWGSKLIGANIDRHNFRERSQKKVFCCTTCFYSKRKKSCVTSDIASIKILYGSRSPHCRQHTCTKSIMLTFGRTILYFILLSCFPLTWSGVIRLNQLLGVFLGISTLWYTRSLFLLESFLHIYEFTIPLCSEYCWLACLGFMPYILRFQSRKIQRRVWNIISPEVTWRLQSISHRLHEVSLCHIY